MEHLWSRAVATGGNRWPDGQASKRLKLAETVANHCHPLPSDGKEGVCGSSPQEGFKKGLQIGPFTGCSHGGRGIDLSPEPVPTPGGPSAIWLEQNDDAVWGTSFVGRFSMAACRHGCAVIDQWLGSSDWSRLQCSGRPPAAIFRVARGSATYHRSGPYGLTPCGSRAFSSSCVGSGTTGIAGGDVSGSSRSMKPAIHSIHSADSTLSLWVSFRSTR